jgi:hypothetical protein
MINLKASAVPELHSKTIRDVLQHDKYKGFCRYQSMTPTQWKNEKYGRQAAQARVIINANFFFYLHVPALPCASPVGPAVSDGSQIMTQADTEKIFLDEKSSQASFSKLQTTSVLVMYRALDGSNVATTMPLSEFVSWFGKLSSENKSAVNAVTGHVILQNGKPVDECAKFDKLPGGYAPKWCRKKDARSIVGIQYDGACQAPLPTNRMCGSKILVTNFEKKSSGSSPVWNKWNPGEPDMDKAERPDSSGASVPEMQNIMMSMMMDEVINLDSSGSASFWTDLGSSVGGDFRSQPKDIMPGTSQFRFRPSPTLLGFE